MHVFAAHQPPVRSLPGDCCGNYDDFENGIALLAGTKPRDESKSEAYWADGYGRIRIKRNSAKVTIE